VDDKFKKPTPTPVPKTAGYQDQMKGVKTDGIKTRGCGAAVKGNKARGPMA
jgi:hypothetical protein